MFRRPTYSSFSGLLHFGLLHFQPVRRAAVAVCMLVALTWSGIASADEIHDAAQLGNVAKIKALLKTNPRLASSKDHMGQTPLHVAATFGDDDTVKVLLANKADINPRDFMGCTPLHYAAQMGHKGVVALLLANKADVNARDKVGRTPLNLVTKNDRTGVPELLRQHGGR